MDDDTVHMRNMRNTGVIIKKKKNPWQGHSLFVLSNITATHTPKGFYVTRRVLNQL